MKIMSVRSPAIIWLVKLSCFAYLHENWHKNLLRIIQVTKNVGQSFNASSIIKYFLSGRHLDGVVGVGDDCDEEAEDHVDEERHKGVEVDSAEDPHHAALVHHVLEGGKHVVSVDQREQAL